MGRIGSEQLDAFYDQGYVVARGLLDPVADLGPVVDEYHTVLDSLADELYAQGSIRDRYAEYDFNERFLRIMEETQDVHNAYFDFTLSNKRRLKPDEPMWVGPAVFNIMRNRNLLDAVEQFIGPEIYSNPVQHARLKPPEHRAPRNPENGSVMMGVTPWHQDGGVVTEDASETEMLTVWFPLWDAPVESGCLEVIPYSHRAGLKLHCPSSGGPRLVEEAIEHEEAVAQPMRRGDVLFMTRYTKHSSLPNLSDRIRWSFDLRYNPVGQPSGRDMYPGFVARSRANPASELRDARAWAQLWYDTRARMSAPDYEPESFNRWDSNHPSC